MNDLPIKTSYVLNVLLDMDDHYAKIHCTEPKGVSDMELEGVIYGLITSPALYDDGIAVHSDAEMFTGEAVYDALASAIEEGQFRYDHEIYEKDGSYQFFPGEKMKHVVSFYCNDSANGVVTLSYDSFPIMKKVNGEIYAYSSFGYLHNVVNVPFANWFPDYAAALDKYESDNSCGLSTRESAFQFSKTAEIMLSCLNGRDVRLQIPPYGERGWKRYTDYRYDYESLAKCAFDYPRVYVSVGSTLTGKRDEFLKYALTRFKTICKQCFAFGDEKYAALDEAVKPLLTLCEEPRVRPHDNRTLYALMPLVLQLQEKKERDYGRSWNCEGDPTLGHMTACSEILKKSKRIENLIRLNADKGFKDIGGWNSDNEPFTDTLLDLAVYCLLYRAWIADMNPGDYLDYCAKVGVTENVGNFPVN